MTAVPTASEPATARGLPPEAARTLWGDVVKVVRDYSVSGDLLRQLVKRDVSIRYKQAVFGFAWAVLVPIAVVLAGLTVRIALAKAAGRTVTSSQIAGMTIKSVPWAFFVGCLNTGTPSLVANMSLVTKIYFPREVLPLASVLAQTFDSAIGIAIVVLALPFLGVKLSPAVLWAPVMLALLWIFAFACALILSCANLFFRDVKYLVQVFLTFGIFVTPVLLDAPMFGARGTWLIMLNPVAPMLEGLRLAVVEKHNLLEPLAAPAGFPFWGPGYLLYSVAWAFGLLLLSSLIFHRAEERFAELG